MQTMSFLIQTDLFLSAFNPWWHEERDTNYKGLCKPYYADTLRLARHILLYLRFQLISSGRDPNWSDLIRFEKLNCRLQRSNLNSRLFKILKFSGCLF